MKTMMIAILALLAAGCATAQRTAEDVAAEVSSELSDQPTATAELRDAQGRSVGRVTLVEEEDGVDVEVHVTGLPAGTHGFHIHETGTCTPPDFTSAGGHYNPTGRQHGLENPQGPHAGDMQNITVGADGSGHFELENPRVRISAGANTLFDADGSAIVVHATADDHRSNPSGNAGARIACGVIMR